MADFGYLTTRDGKTGFAIDDHFMVADFTNDNQFEHLMASLGRPEPINAAIEAAGINPLDVAFEVIGASDRASLEAFLDAEDENSAPEAVWVGAWGQAGEDNDRTKPEGISTEDFVFVRVI